MNLLVRHRTDRISLSSLESLKFSMTFLVAPEAKSERISVVK